MVLGTYREFFAAIAGAAAALTGLLFVAMSVAPRNRPDPGPVVIRQVRASAALLAFVNALAVSVFGLVSGNAAGHPAVELRGFEPGPLACHTHSARLASSPNIAASGLDLRR